MLANESEEFIRNPTAVVSLVPVSTFPDFGAQVEEPLREICIPFHECQVAFAKFDSPPPSTNSGDPLDEITVTVNHPDENAEPEVVILRPEDRAGRPFDAKTPPTGPHLGSCHHSSEDLVKTPKPHAQEGTWLFTRRCHGLATGWRARRRFSVKKDSQVIPGQPDVCLVGTGTRCPCPLFLVTKSSSRACLFAISSLMR